MKRGVEDSGLDLVKQDQELNSDIIVQRTLFIAKYYEGLEHCVAIAPSDSQRNEFDRVFYEHMVKSNQECNKINARKDQYKHQGTAFHMAVLEWRFSTETKDKITADCLQAIVDEIPRIQEFIKISGVENAFQLAQKLGSSWVWYRMPWWGRNTGNLNELSSEYQLTPIYFCQECGDFI